MNILSATELNRMNDRLRQAEQHIRELRKTNEDLCDRLVNSGIISKAYRYQDGAVLAHNNYSECIVARCSAHTAKKVELLFEYLGLEFVHVDEDKIVKVKGG